VRSLIDAWDAAMQGEDLATFAEKRPALKAAMDAFSK